MNENTKFNQWIDRFENKKPFIMAGPCSAETEEQVLAVAHELKNTKVSVLRAGIWKPRTRPGNFEGVGAIGLKWLQKAKQETGLLTATEVASREHIKLAIEHDIDILWIGARTTVSPFIIQDLAEALNGTDKIVLIKNPVNPDLALWLGAVERFYTQNIKNLGVIHRGFSTYEKSEYRNNPEWQIPIDLKSKFPNLPLICDPSHIAGRRDIIGNISQTSMDLMFDGLMIETHCSPDNAWSDAKQQVTPINLLNIIDDLQIRKISINDNKFESELNHNRSKIDYLDKEIIEILGKRMKIAEQIGLLKKGTNVAILQEERWKTVLEKMINSGEKNMLSKEFINRLFKAIHQESIEHQENVFK